MCHCTGQSQGWVWDKIISQYCCVTSEKVLHPSLLCLARQAPLSMGIPQARTLEWLHCLLQCMKVKSESEVAQSCRTLSDPLDCSPPGSSIHGVLQAKYWSGAPVPSLPSSRGSAKPRDGTQVSRIAGGFFTIWATTEAQEYWSG